MITAEPIVILPGGVAVLQGVIEMCQSLLDDGHTITIDPDIGIVVTPDCHEDILGALENASEDVAAILDAWARPVTVH